MDDKTYELLKSEFNTAEFKNYLRSVKGNKCLFCGSQKDIEYHHIVPLSQGGDNRINNIVPLCAICHIKAHEKKPIEGKTYKSKGRKEKYFAMETSTHEAMEALGMKKTSFYRLKKEYQEEHGVECVYNRKGLHQYWDKKIGS